MDTFDKAYILRQASNYFVKTKDFLIVQIKRQRISCQGPMYSA